MSVSRETRTFYGPHLRVEVGIGNGEPSANVSMWATGVSSGVVLTRDELAAHRDAINAVLAEQDCAAAIPTKNETPGLAEPSVS